MRALMIGGGCRGLDLARELTAEGHAVRVVTRDPGRREEIEAAGGEYVAADPDRIGTLRYALDNVTVLLWLLGTASGDAEKVGALHGSRLEMMLERTIDTMVRGLVYEPHPDHPGGADLVRARCAYNEIPHTVLASDPSDRGAWVSEVRQSIDQLLATAR